LTARSFSTGVWEGMTLKVRSANVIKENKFGNILFEWADALVYALIFIVLLFTLLLRVTSVIGYSMEPTLYEKDTLILSKLFYKPKVGDIVVITKASFSEDPIVKRIIATGGQTVNIDFATGKVYVDDQLLDEPYISDITRAEGDMSFPLYVPEGYVFVMGDNRNYSTDSRWSVIGLIDERMIMGRVLFRILPLSSIGAVK
jgi:signal peptidase I